MDGKFCVECGARISIDARFCRACGRRQPEIKIPPELAAAAPKAEPAAAEPVREAVAEPAETVEEVTEKAGDTVAEAVEKPVEAVKAVTEAAEEVATVQEPQPAAAEASKPEPRAVPDYRSYLNNGEPEPPQVEEVPEPEKEGGINPAYILLIGCALFIVALLVWAIFATNKLTMTHQSKEKSSASITIVKPTEPPVTTTDPKQQTTSPKIGGGEYSGVGGKAAAFIEDGDYTVGENIEAGEYIFIAEEPMLLSDDDDEENIPSFYAGVYNDAYEETRIRTGWFQCSTYMKLENGQTLEFSWAKAYPAGQYDGENSPFEHPGMFCVGRDVKPGTYSLEALTDQGYESYAIYDSIEDVMADTDGYDSRAFGIDEDEKITLTDGQYIQLEWCRLKKRTA